MQRVKKLLSCFRRARLDALLLAFFFLSFGGAAVCAADQGRSPEARWWRGCLHAHSLWSDGDVFPEVAADWYQRHGYHFLALTDHNRFQEGERWLVQQVPKNPGSHGRRGVASPEAMQAYRALFGPRWVDERTSAAGKRQVRLKTWDEIRGKFDDPGRFLLLPGEEITGRVHLNAFNINRTIELPKTPKDQADAAVWLARQMNDLALAQAEGGRPVLVQLNHPGWARSPLTIDEVARIDFINLMEINNDDSGTSASIPGAERMWDAVLARRIERGLPPMLVTAGDDTHEYIQPNDAPDGGPGHGWVMVRAAELTTENILAALAAGDFYASSGVILGDLRFDGRRLELRIEPKPRARYTTEFIGQRRGGQPGQVLATVAGTSPAYELKDGDLYVRAKITSSRLRPVRGGEPVHEMAWTQPCLPARER